MAPRLGATGRLWSTALTHWKRNIIILCFAQLLTLVGFSAYLPFIPYYVQELGAGTYEQAVSWLAVFETSSAIAMMISAPVWGSLADRYGRKLMLIRATLAGAILAFTMGFAQSPLQLVVIRFLQGIFCGTVSAAITLVVTETPDEHLGMALGAMQTIQFMGFATGPLVGGIAADRLGYRAVFPISASMMAIAFGAIALLVRERYHPSERRSERSSLQMGAKALSAILTRNTVVLLLTLGSIRFATSVLGPILSLYIKSLSVDQAHIATLAGAIISVSSLTSALSALTIGHLGDRIGQKAVLLFCGIGVALVHIPQAFVGNPTHLLMLRGVQGLFMGGVMPTANALLAKNTPPSRRGAIFGLLGSVQSGGRALGPLVGAGVANIWGMANVFLVTAGVLGVIAAMVGATLRAQPDGSVVAEELPSLAASERAGAPTSSCS